jgi:hypothetical protein
MFANLTTVQQHIKSGKVRALAIGTAQRSLVVPELPTVAEAGVPGYEANNWNGVVVPAAGEVVNGASAVAPTAGPPRPTRGVVRARLAAMGRP